VPEKGNIAKKWLQDTTGTKRTQSGVGDGLCVRPRHGRQIQKNTAGDAAEKRKTTYFCLLYQKNSATQAHARVAEILVRLGDMSFLVSEYLHRLFHFLADGHVEGTAALALATLDALAGMMFQCLVFGCQLGSYLAGLLGQSPSEYRQSLQPRIG